MCDTSNEIISSAINIFLHSVYHMPVRSNWGCFFYETFPCICKYFISYTYRKSHTRQEYIQRAEVFFPELCNLTQRSNEEMTQSYLLISFNNIKGASCSCILY